MKIIDGLSNIEYFLINFIVSLMMVGIAYLLILMLYKTIVKWSFNIREYILKNWIMVTSFWVILEFFYWGIKTLYFR